MSYLFSRHGLVTQGKDLRANLVQATDVFQNGNDLCQWKMPRAWPHSIEAVLFKSHALSQGKESIADLDAMDFFSGYCAQHVQG